MRAFYICVDYLKELLEQDIAINTITHGLRSLIDIDKKNIFNLAHIQVISSTQKQNHISFVFEIVIVALRMTNKDIVTDKFLSNDNELDNLNTCHASLNMLISKIQTLNNDYNIELANEPILQPIIFEESNLLDGWRTEIELIIPNTEISVC